MKKILAYFTSFAVVLHLLFAGILMFAGVASSQALDIQAGEEMLIIEPVDGDLYGAAGRIDIKVPIEGDAVLAGGEIYIQSDISQDAILAGGDIQVLGIIGDDARIAGGNVRIESDILGDLIIFGGDVDVAEGVTIHGDVVGYAGRFQFDGILLGDMKLSSDQFILGGVVEGNAEVSLDSFKNPLEKGVIKGNLEYSNEKKLEFLEKFAQGKIEFHSTLGYDEEKDEFDFPIVGLVFKMLGIFIFASLFYFLNETTFTTLGKRLRKQVLSSGLHGLFFVAVIPVIIIILLITVIGIPFALLLLSVYIFTFVFLALLNTLVITGLLVQKYSLEKWYQKLGLIFVGAFIFAYMGFISFIVGLFTIGVIMKKIAPEKK